MPSGFSFFPPQALTLALEIDNLYLHLGIVAFTAFFALIVVVFVVYFAIKHRDDTGDMVGAPITGSMPLELGWSLIPFLISIGIFVWALIVFFQIVRGP
jgi:cytochrome c oxidase subunit 2